MDSIAHYLEYTYLKTAKESGLTDRETFRKLGEMLVEAYENNFHAVVMRQRFLRMAHRFREEHSVGTQLVTVVSFPLGINTLGEKKEEIEKSIANHVDELDIVINYRKYLAGDKDVVYDEILKLTPLVIEKEKTVKWIIETAALNDEQITDIAGFINNCALKNFSQEERQRIFVKTSTGYLFTPQGVPNGATMQAFEVMKKAVPNVRLKASGGIRNRSQAEAFINAGAHRIGTSSAMAILFGSPQSQSEDY